MSAAAKVLIYFNVLKWGNCYYYHKKHLRNILKKINVYCYLPRKIPAGTYDCKCSIYSELLAEMV